MLDTLHCESEKLRCYWDGRTVLHNCNCELIGVGQFSGEIKREAHRVRGHESWGSLQLPCVTEVNTPTTNWYTNVLLSTFYRAA